MSGARIINMIKTWLIGIILDLKKPLKFLLSTKKIKMLKFMMRVVVLGWLVLNLKNMVLPTFMVLTFQENY